MDGWREGCKFGGLGIRRTRCTDMIPEGYEDLSWLQFLLATNGTVSSETRQAIDMVE